MELMTKDAVCVRLKISPRTLENWVKQRRFPPGVQIGKPVYWSADAIDAWQAHTFSKQLAWQRTK